MKLTKALIFVMVMMLTITSISVLFTDEVSATTYKYNYNSKIPISASASGNAQSGYPVPLAIYSGSGTNSAGIAYLNGHSLNWPYDIRFSTQSGNDLPFYRTDYTGSVQHVWINVTTINATGTTNIFMYYGKSTATDASNSDNTFIFYDNFNDGTLNKWSMKGSQTIDSGTKIDGNSIKFVNGQGAITKNITTRTSSFMVNMALLATGTTAGVSGYPVLAYSSVPQTVYSMVLTQNSGGKIQYYQGSYVNWPAGYTYSTGSFQYLSLGFNFADGRQYGTYAGTSMSSIYLKSSTGSSVTSINAIAISSPAVATNAMYVDNVMVRNWVLQEPTVGTPGAETTNTYPTWAPTFTNTPSNSCVLGEVFSYTPTVNETSTFTLISKPSWATWYGGNSTLVGRATSSGITSCSIRATSVDGESNGYQNWTLTVNQQWSATFTNTPDETTYVTYSYTYTPTCNETVTYTLLSKPDWASWADNSISGTAIDGVYTFSIRATSTPGTLYSYQNWTLTVSQMWAPTFTSTPITDLTGLVLYNYTLSTNETSQFTSIVLPTWGHYQNGSVYGTPTTLGLFDFSIRAVSTSGLLYSYQNWTLTVSGYAPNYVAYPNTITKINAGYTYTATLNETGTIDILDSPSWLAFDNVNKISGTPTVLGTYNVSIKATSTIGTLSTYLNYTIQVNAVWAPIFTNNPDLHTNTDHPGYFAKNTTFWYTPTTNESVTYVIISMPGTASWLPYNDTVCYNLHATGVFTFNMRAYSDNGSLYAEKSWSITVYDTNQTYPASDAWLDMDVSTSLMVILIGGSFFFILMTYLILRRRG